VNELRQALGTADEKTERRTTREESPPVDCVVEKTGNRTDTAPDELIYTDSSTFLKVIFPFLMKDTCKVRF